MYYYDTNIAGTDERPKGDETVKKIINNPENVVEEMLHGLAIANPAVNFQKRKERKGWPGVRRRKRP